MGLEWIGSLAIGLCVGVVSSFLGLGGGILIVPLLPLVSKMPYLEVVATSLTAILLVVTNNTWSFARKGYVDWSTALTIGPLTAVGAYSSAYGAEALPVWLMKALLLLVILFLVIRNLTGLGGVSEGSRKKGSALRKRLSGAFLGSFAGVLSGLTGIGAGAIVAPSLANFGWVHGYKVVPTTNAVMIFTSFFGALAFATKSSGGHLPLGFIHVDKALLIVAGAMISSYWGRRHQHQVPDQWRKRLLNLVLVILSIKVAAEIFLELR